VSKKIALSVALYYILRAYSREIAFPIIINDFSRNADFQEDDKIRYIKRP